MRFFLLSVLVVCLASVSVYALADEAPVPEGFSLPNIFNPVLDRADGRSQAKDLVNLVAKEPKVAYGVGNEGEKKIEDTWNGEKDAESSASVQQKKMMREVTHLEQLIAQGKRILKVLPIKKRRLVKLKRALSKILDAKAKREASEKLDTQQALLNAIRKREQQMASRLAGLKNSQKKLEGSVTKLRKVISGKKNKKGAKKGAAAKGAKKVGATLSAKAAKRRFAQVGLDSEQEAEIGVEVENEAEAEESVDTEAEVEQEAAEQTME